MSNSGPTLTTARSFLFAPASDERKLARALDADADAVIADLEDAVLPREKSRAREIAATLLRPRRAGVLRLVRVNGTETEWFSGDVEAIAAIGLDGIVLPKATPEAAAAAAELGVAVVAIVETAVGLLRAPETAAASPVACLMLGAVDLGLDLRLEPRPDALELLHARSSIVLASAAAGLRPPVDRVWVDIRDAVGLGDDCAFARSLGFRGKACIHPDQVTVVNEGFAPTEGDLGRARAIVAAFEQAEAEGIGAVALDGEMIDLPVVERARELLAEAKRSVLHGD